MSNIATWEHLLAEAGFTKVEHSRDTPINISVTVVKSTTDEDRPTTVPVRQRELTYPLFIWIDVTPGLEQFRTTLAILEAGGSPWRLSGELRDLRKAPFGFRLETFTPDTLQ